MSRTPATITQAEVARIIRAAKQAGAKEVIVPVRNQRVIVRLEEPSTGVSEALESTKEIVL